MTTTYLVTGGAGCIGSELCSALLSRGDRVVALDNLSSGREEHIAELLNNSRFRFLRGDLLDPPALEAALEEVDFVYHLAANSDVKFNADEPDRDLRQNLVATQQLLEAMRRRGLRKLAFSSTSAVYGNSVLQPIPESQACRPISLYGASKLACEAMIAAYSNLFHIQAWVFRFANVVGGKVRKVGRTVISDFIAKLRRDSTRLEILGNGKQAKSYIQTSACVDSMLFVVEHAQTPFNLYNLGADDVVSVTRIAELVVEAMGLKQVRFDYTGTEAGWPGDVPRFLLDVAALNMLGWRCRQSSEAAITHAIQEILAHD